MPVVILFLVFQVTSILISTVAVLIYILTNSVEGNRNGAGKLCT
jgi:hypothetical protein